MVKSEGEGAVAEEEEMGAPPANPLLSRKHPQRQRQNFSRLQFIDP